MVYYVTEYQTDNNGGMALVSVYNTRTEAESAYYQTLFSAVNSDVPKHGVSLMTEDMNLIKSDLAYKDDDEEILESPEEFNI